MPQLSKSFQAQAVISNRSSFDQIPQIALRLYQSTCLDTTFQVAVDEVRHYLQTDRVFFYQLEQYPNGKIVAESVGSDWAALKDSETHELSSYQDSWYEHLSGQALIIEDMSRCHLPESYIELLEQWQVKSAVILPIFYHCQFFKNTDDQDPEISPQQAQMNRLWGLMMIHHCCDQRVWRTIDIAFLQQLSRQIGTIIQEKRFQQLSERLIDSTNDGIMAVDQDLRLITWNRSMERFSGIDRQQVLGNLASEILPWLVPMQEEHYLLQALAGKSIISPNKQFPFVQGYDQHFFEADYSPLIAEVGEIGGSICVFRDITEQENVRTQLEQAKNMAELANEAKSDFLTTISHEIRTPMNAVIGMAELLLDTNLSTDQRSSVEGIRQGGDTLLRLINEILDFSKIEAGKLELECAPLDLATCIQEAQDLIRVQATSKQIYLSTSISEEVPKNISGDITRLKQILVNCLSNAVKFTQSGEIQIIVTSKAYSEISNTTVSSEYEMKHLIQFSIQDTGVGIPAKLMHRLFQSFSQADSSITRHFGGTGLGLVISKQLCELMGGQIWVESRGIVGGNPAEDFAPGSTDGATFYFTIMASGLDSASDSQATLQPNSTTHSIILPQNNSSQSGSEHLRSPSSLKILLVDDVPMNQTILLKMLQRFGYQADQVNSGDAAIAALKQQPYDIIFMDIQMPDMDGLTATQIIRQDAHLKQPWIVAVTAHAMPGTRDKYLSQGIDDYITKPVQKSDLMTVLKQVRLAQPSCLLQKLAEYSESFNISALDSLKAILSDDTEEIIIELFQNYLEDAPEMVHKIRLAIQEQNTASIRELSHALRSVSVNLGINKLSQFCQVLEFIEEDCFADRIDQQFQLIVQEYQQVETILQASLSL
jgi:PAS domain S-box-containing protein